MVRMYCYFCQQIFKMSLLCGCSYLLQLKDNGVGNAF